MKEKKIFVLERIVMAMCVILLFIMGVFTYVFVYTESDNFFKEVNNSSKENYPVSEKQMSLLGSLSKDETVNITAETAGAISGSDYRVSLSGNIYYANTSTGERSNKWVVLIHGFMMSGESMANAIGQVYLDYGYNILAPDLRGAGNSGGETGMGFLESLDIWDWLTYLNTNYNVDEVIVHGLSLGGATTLQLWSQKDQGRDLESQHVVGLIDDCGYTSMTGIIQGLLGTVEGIDLLADVLNLVGVQSLYTLIGEDNIRNFLIDSVGVGLNSSNFAKNQDTFAAGRVFSNVPILVIHGTDDPIVPYSNSTTVINEANNRGLDATLWSVEGQTHAFIVAGIEKQEYRNHVVEFINKVSKNPPGNVETPSGGNNSTQNTLNQVVQLIDSLFNQILDTIKQFFS